MINSGTDMLPRYSSTVCRKETFKLTLYFLCHNRYPPSFLEPLSVVCSQRLSGCSGTAVRTSIGGLVRLVLLGISTSGEGFPDPTSLCPVVPLPPPTRLTPSAPWRHQGSKGGSWETRDADHWGCSNYHGQTLLRRGGSLLQILLP